MHTSSDIAKDADIEALKSKDMSPTKHAAASSASDTSKQVAELETRVDILM